MSICIEYFQAQKAGNMWQENEDALNYRITPTSLRLCIADGATMAPFAKLWVDILTTKFVEEIPAFIWTNKPTIESNESKATRFKDWLLSAALEWRSHIDFTTIPAHVFPNMKKGAYGTILGVHMHFRSQVWRAVAVGDCEMFIVRESKLFLPKSLPGTYVVTAWPLTEAKQFGYAPNLVYTNPQMNADLVDQLKINRGNFKSGDIFIFASDALAKFIFEYGHPQKIFSSRGEFNKFIETERNTGRLKNDDVALVIVKIL